MSDFYAYRALGKRAEGAINTLIQRSGFESRLNASTDLQGKQLCDIISELAHHSDQRLSCGKASDGEETIGSKAGLREPLDRKYLC